MAASLTVMLTYLFAKRERFAMAGVAAAVAVLCRQTNVVWVGFVMGVTVLGMPGGRCFCVVVTLFWQRFLIFFGANVYSLCISSPPPPSHPSAFRLSDLSHTRLQTSHTLDANTTWVTLVKKV